MIFVDYERGIYNIEIPKSVTVELVITSEGKGVYRYLEKNHWDDNPIRDAD